MPPPKIPPPGFSPVGRYLINVDERLDKTTPNYFHDTENYKPECGIENMPSNSVSRFINKSWAKFRGYIECQYCK